MNINCIDKIRKKINLIKLEKEANIDGLLVTNNTNMLYILGISIEGYVYINNNKVYVITDSRYIEEVKNAIYGIDNVKCINIFNQEEIIELLKDKVVLVESKDLTLYKSKIIKEKYLIKKLIETEDFIEEIRMIKEEYEIECIAKACKIADDAFSYILNYIKVGMTEIEIRDELEDYMKKLGGEGISFDTIVASGPNSSKPHAICSDRKIQSQDIILFDFGCKYKGYCSDMSRTIFVGSITKKQEKVYNLVKKAQQLVIENIKEGVKTNYLDNLVHDLFKTEQLEENYLHSLGHGVGLDIHELPPVSIKSSFELKENMIVTDEPGIYFENEFGIRIEDTICVKKDGILNLCNSKKDIIII